jgi:hypothetical protein
MDRTAIRVAQAHFEFAHLGCRGEEIGIELEFVVAEGAAQSH